MERPLVLWAVLIVAFLAVWQLLNGSTGSSGGSTPPDPAAPASSGPPIWNLVILGASVVATLGWARWLRRRTVLFNEESTSALELFAAADYTGSAARFGALAEKYRRPAAVRVTAQFNLGMSQLRTGDLARAMETLTALDRRMPRGFSSFRAKIASQMAAVYALRGEPAAADRWIAEAEARIKRTGQGQAVEGALIFSRLVNGIRRNDHQAALEALAAAWERLEGTLPVTEMRPFVALRAFATMHEKPGEPVTAEPSVRAALQGVRPGELAWLAAEWPEMRAFLDAFLDAAVPDARASAL